MTRDELIEHLKTLPEDILFLVASDEEGNSYRRMNVGGVEKAYPLDKRSYQWQTMAQEDIEDGEYDEDDLAEAVDVVVFW